MVNGLSNSGIHPTTFQTEVLGSQVTICFSEAPGKNVKKNIVDILTVSFERQVQETLFTIRNGDCAKT